MCVGIMSINMSARRLHIVVIIDEMMLNISVQYTRNPTILLMYMAIEYFTTEKPSATKTER